MHPSYRLSDQIVVRFHALRILILCAVSLVTGSVASEVQWTLRARDRQGGIIQRTESVEPAKVGVVVMDMWAYHWCMTCAERASALVPRMNLALEGARRLGMTVIFTPTSAIAASEKSPQRRAARLLPDAPWPALLPIQSPQCGLKNPFSCRCGPGIDCPRNWGGDAMHLDLKVAPKDFVAWGTREVWNIIGARQLKKLIYVGIAADICVLGKGEGIVPMSRLGVPCILARDLTDTDSYPPQEALEHTLKIIETELASTIDFAEFLNANDAGTDWDRVESVRIRPWGKPQRPYFFREKCTVYLEPEAALGVEIRYTVDGSLPDTTSLLYSQAMVLTNRTRLRVRRFRGGKPVGLESDAFYERLPVTPPVPTLRLWELEPLRIRYSDLKSEWHVPARTWGMTLRGVDYHQGITLHAPGWIEFRIPPGTTRFVALAGADDAPKGRFNAQFLGQRPSMVFRVVVDGKRVADSPVMRLGQVPWPFDIPLPKDAKTLRLEVADAGDGSRLDYGDFVQAGFLIPEYVGPRNLY